MRAGKGMERWTGRRKVKNYEATRCRRKHKIARGGEWRRREGL